MYCPRDGDTGMHEPGTSARLPALTSDHGRRRPKTTCRAHRRSASGVLRSVSRGAFRRWLGIAERWRFGTLGRCTEPRPILHLSDRSPRPSSAPWPRRTDHAQGRRSSGTKQPAAQLRSGHRSAEPCSCSSRRPGRSGLAPRSPSSQQCPVPSLSWAIVHLALRMAAYFEAAEPPSGRSDPATPAASRPSGSCR